MSPSTPSSQVRQKRARGARSVLGCLTCRRRRVKCVVQMSPCNNCQQLNLTCTPSFHYNFKNWTPIGATQRNTESPSNVSGSEPAATASPQALRSGETEESSQENGQIVASLPQDILLWVSTGLNNGSFDMTAPSVELDPESRFSSVQKQQYLPFFDADLWGSFSPHNFSYNGSNDLSGMSTYGNRMSQIEVAATERDEADIEIPTDLRNPTDFSVSEGLDAFTSATFPIDLNNIWHIPPQVRQFYGNSHSNISLLNQHESNMPKLLTAKSSPWNPYSYMLNSTRKRPESPLRHGILSWTCCYLSCREQNSAYSGAEYYVSASNSVKSIISELRGNASSDGFLRKASEKSEKLYMMLSTSYFLSQCDVMLCDYKSLYDRLDSIRDLFEEHWRELNGSMNTLDRRLLTWLAYLDLRSSLFGNQKFRRPGRSTKQKDLISVLIDLDGLSSLRVVSGGQSYLSACYGDSYPATELQDDLRQEPCHMKCDDVLSIFSSLNNFETWNEEHPPDSGDAMLEELRSAKIQAIRANLSRIRAECQILFSPSFPSENDGVDRTAFHALTVIALHLSATILLNRILKPDIRTDSESQEAAHEIIRISYRFRKAKYLDTPRSLLWPLPLFVAGIETTDEIYRDWILSYMTELEHWGGYIKKSRELLEDICKRQKRDGRRIRVRDAMNDLNMTLIV